MHASVFDFPLPAHLIAQKPKDQRDASRLLVVDRKNRTLSHRHFRDLPEYLQAGDCLFRNNAAVIPARLRAMRPTGGQVECLLLRPAIDLPGPSSGSESDWWCLLRPGKKLAVGATFGLTGFFSGTVREKTADGLARVCFVTESGNILDVANRIGEMPLPPYIAERANPEDRALDHQRYQTVYADRSHQVAAAAPTAGLHFTPELLAQLSHQGIKTADLTLHVGLGTFRPITTENIEDHVIHREAYEISPATQRALVETPGRKIAVGTTSVRTLEDYTARLEGESPSSKTTAIPPTGAKPGADIFAETNIFIFPPYRFRAVDALITNFHQPKSTLLCLVAAFLTPGSTNGADWLREIYAEAVARQYRFFSYGDAMLIL